jgi:hypothetical protein
MPRLSNAEQLWKDILDDPNSTPKQKKEAAREREIIKRRHARIKIAKKKTKVRENDPEPSHNPLCGMLSCVSGCKHIAWYNRQPTPVPAVKIEQPKPAPVIEVAALPVVPKPAPARKPAPVSVVRKAREGHSGKFFKEVFYDLPIYERNAILRTLNPAQQAEWQTILEQTTLPPAQPVRVVLTEDQKLRMFSSPMVLPPAAGQPQTIEEVQKTFGSTMGNATPDSGLSPDLDRRGWLPDINPLN